jgi:hypothetical protein
MTLITRQGKGSRLSIEEMDGNLTYLEQLTQSGFKKITIPLGVQEGGIVGGIIEGEGASSGIEYYITNEENLFFGQFQQSLTQTHQLLSLFSFYEDVDGLIHIGVSINFIPISDAAPA